MLTNRLDFFFSHVPAHILDHYLGFSEAIIHDALLGFDFLKLIAAGAQ